VTHKSAICSALLVASALGTGTAHAQFGGFGGTMPPHVAWTMVRSMGFDPVGRPAFDGGRYWVRATDPRGANVYVVVDAQSRRVVMVRPIPGSVPLSSPGAVPLPGRPATLHPEDDGPGDLLGQRGGAWTEDGIPPRGQRGLPNQTSARPFPPPPPRPSAPPREASGPEGDAARDLPTGWPTAPAAQRPDIVIGNRPPYIRTRPLPPTTSSTPAAATGAATVLPSIAPLE
jgi:hypothetical protein